MAKRTHSDRRGRIESGGYVLNRTRKGWVVSLTDTEHGYHRLSYLLPRNALKGPIGEGAAKPLMEALTQYLRRIKGARLIDQP